MPSDELESLTFRYHGSFDECNHLWSVDQLVLGPVFQKQQETPSMTGVPLLFSLALLAHAQLLPASKRGQ